MEVRKRMTKDVLSVAMSVVDFYKVPRPLAPSVYHVVTEVPEELKRANEYIQACLGVDCEDPFALTIPKLLASGGLQENVIQLRLKEVILPLIAYRSVASAATGSRPVAGFSDLAEKALALHLKATLANPRGISQADVADMIQAAMTCGQPDFFFTE